MLVLVLVLEIPTVRTGRRGSSCGWLGRQGIHPAELKTHTLEHQGDYREAAHALIPSSQIRNSSDLSIIMIGIGLYIRLGILETPIFSRLVAEAL